ncbi:transposase [Burkholderia savannae]|uniref:transposase n=1 Tax=Burkholderia TaxID=32008 RepID=UPI000AD56729
MAIVARELGISEQTLRNWVKVEATGEHSGAGSKPVKPEQMELEIKKNRGIRTGRESAGPPSRV